MLKQILLSLSLFFVIPAYSMKIVKSKVPQRGYATKKNLEQMILDEKDRVLSPEAFKDKLANMQNDIDINDLKNIRSELIRIENYSKYLLYGSKEPDSQIGITSLYTDRYSKEFHFWNPNGILELLRIPALGVAVSGAIATIFVATIWAYDTFDLLPLQTLEEPETCLIEFIDEITWLGQDAIITFIAAAYYHFPDNKFIQKHLKHFSYTYKVHQTSQTNLNYVTSLIEKYNWENNISEKTQ